MPAMEIIKSGTDALLEFVYPSCCLNCNEYIEQPGELVCPNCWDKIETFDHIFCSNCENPLSSNLICLNCGGQDAMPILALGQYVDPLDEIVRFFKYRKFPRLGRTLGEKLIANHSKLLDKVKIDIIIPIPLHSYRFKFRGYNQSLILADTIGKRLDIPVLENGASRKKC